MTPKGPHWYIAYVKQSCEKKAAEYLSRRGIENYLPTRREIHRWSDRNKIVEVVLLPHLIFVRCKEHERVKIPVDNPYCCSFMADGNGGAFHPAIVSDQEMDAFRSLVEHGAEQLEISPAHLAKGDRVKIINGPLAGTECELISVGSRKCVGTGIGPLGTAYLEVSPSDIVKVNKQQQ